MSLLNKLEISPVSKVGREPGRNLIQVDKSLNHFTITIKMNVFQPFKPLFGLFRNE